MTDLQPGRTLGPAKQALALFLIVIGYLFLGTLYAILTPSWQNPDEPAHYNYIGHLVETGRLPVLKPGDYDQDLLEALLAEDFPKDAPLTRLVYQSHQPPLYYLLTAPVHAASGGSLIVMRLATVFLGLGIVLIAYAVAQRLYPGEPLVALGTAAFVAFLPQHNAMMAAVNNDALAGLLAATLLLLSLHLVQAPRLSARFLLLCGVVLGLGLITKATVYPIAWVLLFAMVWRWRRQRKPRPSSLLRPILLVIVPALLIAVPWWLRNAVVYGWPDLLGLIRHSEVVIGQPRTTDWIVEHGLAAWLVRGSQFTFQSFWGQFGWMAAVMDFRIYFALGLATILAALGCLLPSPGRIGPADYDAVPLVLLTLQLLLVVAAYIAFNATFVQHQGRYLFAAVIPLAFMFAAGWHALLHSAWLRAVSAALTFTAALMVLVRATLLDVSHWYPLITVIYALLLLMAGHARVKSRNSFFLAVFVGLFTVNLHAIFQRILPLLAHSAEAT